MKYHSLVTDFADKGSWEYRGAFVEFSSNEWNGNEKKKKAWTDKLQEQME